MLLDRKLVLCRYYGKKQNVFSDAEIINGSLSIRVEISKENSPGSDITILFFDEINTRKIFSLVKIRDFVDEFYGVEGLKKFNRFCRNNSIKSKMKKVR
ncbi:MAG TPA: hypothetical protein PLT36_03540 [Erysipelotrichaceae bacterium]|jgi:hypothetical protein|nr:hypothetical protein [Erysipelotrichaceae bacterium]HQA84596.1 hypothetical protein [Erysipelotrichaceae bacterium]